MKLSAKIRLGMVAAIAGAVTCFVVPASALTGEFFTLTGTGTISPGLTLTGGAQTWSFSGNGAIVHHNAIGAISCTWNGDDTIGTTTQGSGNFSGTCNTPCGPSGVSGSFTRTVDGVAVQGAFTSGCLAPSSFHGECGHAPTSAPAVTSYAAECYFQFD
ncbi:MAG: hypothetical protein QOG34_656 [Frankiaceae bacterium]|jgi:hypothetical protein|nr:hypothetical protein [Frankiaceae bacterium]